MNVKRTSSLKILADLCDLCHKVDRDMTPEKEGFMIHARCGETTADLRKLLHDGSECNDAVRFIVNHAEMLPYDMGLYITDVKRKPMKLLSQKENTELLRLAKPLMKWLADHGDPMSLITVVTDRVAVYDGVAVNVTHELDEPVSVILSKDTIIGGYQFFHMPKNKFGITHMRPCTRAKTIDYGLLADGRIALVDHPPGLPENINLILSVHATLDEAMCEITRLIAEAQNKGELI